MDSDRAYQFGPEPFRQLSKLSASGHLKGTVVLPLPAELSRPCSTCRGRRLRLATDRAGGGSSSVSRSSWIQHTRLFSGLLKLSVYCPYRRSTTGRTEPAWPPPPARRIDAPASAHMYTPMAQQAAGAPLQGGQACRRDRFSPHVTRAARGSTPPPARVDSFCTQHAADSGQRRQYGQRGQHAARAARARPDRQTLGSAATGSADRVCVPRKP